MNALRKNLANIKSSYADELPKIASILHFSYDMHTGVSFDKVLGGNAVLSAFIPSLDEFEPEYNPENNRCYILFDEVYLITPFVTLRLDGQISFRQYSEWENLQGQLRRCDYIDDLRLEIDGFSESKTDFDEYLTLINRLKK